MVKRKGWRKEPARHSLARRGVKTHVEEARLSARMEPGFTMEDKDVIVDAMRRADEERQRLYGDRKNPTPADLARIKRLLFDFKRYGTFNKVDADELLGRLDLNTAAARSQGGKIDPLYELWITWHNTTQWDKLCWVCGRSNDRWAVKCEDCETAIIASEAEQGR